MNLKKILIPLDDSQLSTVAVPLAAYLAERFESEIVLLRVMNYHGIPPENIDDIRTQAERELMSQTLKFPEELPGRVWLAEEGEPGEAILDYILENDVDLVVMNSHGRDGVSRFLLGSVTEKVARHAHCPVFVVRGEAPAKLSRLVVPLDGSRLAENALRVACELLDDGGELVMLRALRDQEERDSALLYLNTLGGQFVNRGLHCRRVVAKGDPAEAILSGLEETDADAVVMSTHGRSGIGRFFFGSVAEKVLRHSHKPTLLLRPQRETGLVTWLLDLPGLQPL